MISLLERCGQLKMLNKWVYLFLVILLTNGCATLPRQPSRTIPSEGIYHTVESGQTLYRIAKTYNVDIDELMRVNRINDPTKISVGQRLFIPGAKMPLPVETYRPISQEAVERLVGPRYRFSQWCYITLHHSGTFRGNADYFDKNHRQRGMGGLFYHFVIGNGTDSGDGEIEVGWRWKRQEQVNRPYDIQICLVGDFNRETLSNAQFDALVKLIKVLRKQYNIPLENIRKHQDVADRFTECPGKNFPFYKLLRELNKN